MPRPLRVFRFQGWRSECPAAKNGSKQTQEIVAARTIKEAMQSFKCTRSEWNFSGGETWNAEDVAQAMSEPGVVFWRPLDDRGEWRR